MVLNIGVIGAGDIATAAHLPAYSSNQKTSVQAVAELNPETRTVVATEYSIRKTYADGAKMLEEEEIDLVSICTPPNTHHDFLLKAVDEQIHVFCEKPFATGIDEARAMHDAVKNSSILCQPGYAHRFTEHFKKAKHFVREGLIGEVQEVMTRFYVPPPSTSWYYDPDVSGGGIVADRLPHLLDFYLSLFNAPVTVENSIIKAIDTSEVEDFAHVDVRVGGIPITFSLKWVQQGITTSTKRVNTIVGSDGLLEFDRDYFEGNVRGKGMHFKAGQSPTVSVGPLFNWWYKASEDVMEKPIHAFIDNVSSGSPSGSPTVEEGLEIMSVKDEVYGGGGK